MTQSRLKEVLDYDPSSGNFTWIVAYNNALKGSLAGSSDSKGYKIIKVDGGVYKAHRLAFLFMLGELPAELIDHKNQDCSDNSWDNLREVSNTTNCKNAKMPINNTSGVVGVTFMKRLNKWQAQVKVGGKNIYLGVYEDIEDAKAARLEANIKYGFSINHGKGIK